MSYVIYRYDKQSRYLSADYMQLSNWKTLLIHFELIILHGLLIYKYYAKY